MMYFGSCVNGLRLFVPSDHNRSTDGRDISTLSSRRIRGLVTAILIARILRTCVSRMKRDNSAMYAHRFWWMAAGVTSTRAARWPSIHMQLPSRNRTGLDRDLGTQYRRTRQISVESDELAPEERPGMLLVTRREVHAFFRFPRLVLVIFLPNGGPGPSCSISINTIGSRSASCSIITFLA
jgi:hypothetical protein